jgi:CheY-like chemotaxis protein
MKRIRLIHWHPAEAEERAARLRAAGYDAACEPPSRESLEKLWQNPPAAVVIDLTRLPMQGRDVGLLLRQRKSTRSVPLVFVAGDPEKVARVRKSLPDAEFTAWSRIRSSLRRAIARPPADPVVPQSSFEGYSGTPLPEKLGIKANSAVALVGAPRGFEATLGELPPGAVLRRQARGHCDLIVWFTRSRRDLERRLPKMGALARKGGLWIAWPKKSSGVASDLSQALVRKLGLAAGLVDYKVAAIDATWSGLRFARRKSDSSTT